MMQNAFQSNKKSGNEFILFILDNKYISQIINRLLLIVKTKSQSIIQFGLTRYLVYNKDIKSNFKRENQNQSTNMNQTKETENAKPVVWLMRLKS